MNLKRSIRLKLSKTGLKSLGQSKGVGYVEFDDGSKIEFVSSEIIKVMDAVVDLAPDFAAAVNSLLNAFSGFTLDPTFTTWFPAPSVKQETLPKQLCLPDSCLEGQFTVIKEKQMSSTYTIHGLARILELASVMPGIDIAHADGGSNSMLQKYLARNYKTVAQDAKKAKMLTAAGFDEEKKLDKWFEEPAKDAFKVNKNSEQLYMGSVYDFDQKWQDGMGKQTDIKGYVGFGVKGTCYLDTAFAHTKEHATLMFWYSKAKSGYELYCEASNMYRKYESYGKDDAEIIVPNVLIESDEGSYGLEGAKLGIWTIDQSTYINSLTLNEHGAKASSKVRVAMTKSIRKEPRRMVFDKPFATAIIEQGMMFPAFVAYCAKDCWQPR